MDAPNRLLEAAQEIQRFCRIVKSGRLIDWNEVREDLAALLELKGDTTALGRLDELLAHLSTPQGLDH